MTVDVTFLAALIDDGVKSYQHGVKRFYIGTVSNTDIKIYSSDIRLGGQR